jgi:NAD(P)-dependent dehydrogenase (short-subunit alcohol dehydrogenase family)
MDNYTAAVTASLQTLRNAAVSVADKIDEKADLAAAHIRNSLTRLPARAPPPPPVPRTPPSASSRLLTWAWDNKLAVSIVAATSVGIGSYIITQKRAARNRKRRARRAPNGARKEVIVLAGSPHDSIVKSLSTDLERRGFIVFIVVNSMDDEQVVLSLGGRDIRPLNIDLLDTAGAEASISRFESYLNFPVSAFQGAHPHHLHFAGMILIPDSYYPTGPIETISADIWSDVLNLRLLSPFLTSKLFIPLLRAHQSRLLVLTPSITHSLTPPFHAPESVAVAALDSFVSSLRRELRPLGVAISQLRLGTFDLSAVGGRQHVQATNAARADLVSWPAGVRGAYGRSYAAQEGKRPVKGSPLRELHHVVFDLVAGDAKPKRDVRVGSGSLVYDLIGRFAPDGVVAWLLCGGRAPEEPLARGGGSEGSGSEGSVEWERVDKAT